MHITFGMFLDGSEWSSEAASLGKIVCGPLQMLQVLEERLGLSGIQSSTPERINQYVEKIKAVTPDWCRDSFGLDAWTTAQQLLAWRDELIEAGWDAKEAPSQRLQTLATLERNPLPLAAGVPDRLRTVLKALDQAPCSDKIHLTEPLALLPWVWREIFATLRRNGANLIEPEDAAPDAAPEVIQVTGRDEATLATQLARYLAQGDNRSVAIICHGDSGLLDGILHRFGFGAVGEQRSSRWRESLQILPLFLETVWKPFQPQRFLELLLLADAPFPYYIRRPLIDALQKEPGIGGEEWQNAWNQAADTIRKNKHGYYPDPKAELNKLAELRNLLENQSFQAEDKVSASLLIERCKFLQPRLGPQVTKTPGLGTALLHAKALINILNGKTDVSRIELARMLDSIIGSGSDNDDRCAEVNGFHCVNHPAKLQTDCDTVLWWNFLDDGRTNYTSWTEEERTALPDFNPHAARLLEHRSWTNATCHARQRLIVFTPRLLAGEAAFPHPFLNELQNRKEVDAETLCDASGQWRLADRSVKLVRELSTPAPTPSPELAPSSVKPLRRLSYTQMNSLLTCPFQWFLNDYIGLRMPPATNVPTGSQMYGTLAHKVVEKLLTESKSWQPEEAEHRAGELFDELVPQMAAELLLDGQKATLGRIRSTLCQAVKKLFEEINSKNLIVVGTEHECTSTLNGQEFIGKIDILLQDPSKKYVVVDMKWSIATYLQDELKKNNALQLATYTWLLDPAGFDVDCKYFLFPSKQFLESDAPNWQNLWQSAVDTFDIRLKQMAAGYLERSFVEEEKLKQKEPLRDTLPFTKSAVCNFCHFGTLCGREGDNE
ncbi:MAG: PD-(D/E)XK nuclease family protein [Lentisphaerae bacterium]|nr:PD-(D/E)XK nuclease family protein [Lentisphaerota bacterium]